MDVEEKRDRTEYGIDRATFIKVYASSRSSEEAQERLAAVSKKANLPPMPKWAVATRASQLRGQGFNLPKFKPGRKTKPSSDVDEANALIARLVEAAERGEPAPDADIDAGVEAQPAAPSHDEQYVRDVVRELCKKMAKAATDAARKLS